MPAERRAFYEYHASLVEPWDGPAALALHRRPLVGATLDRNGLRPMKYVVTASGFVVAASELGVLDFEAGGHRREGPPAAGPHAPRRPRARAHRRRRGDQARDRVAQAVRASGSPSNKIDLARRCPTASPAPRVRRHRAAAARMRAFGYTREDLRVLLAPMATNGEEPTGSMGNDAPLAVLSDRPQSRSSATSSSSSRRSRTRRSTRSARSS